MVTKARAPAGPQNESRAAGQAATPSAAARAPMEGAKGGASESGFYRPESDAAEEPASALEMPFNEQVRRDHAPLGEHMGTSDVDVAAHAAAEGAEGDEDLDAAIARIRRFRKPLGAFSQKLALPNRSGYHRHWFNDVAGRIDEARANGWAHVKGTDGKPLARAVGTGRDKGVMYAFAMELPLVFWEEDQQAKHDAAMEVLGSVKRNVAQASPENRADKSDKGKFYDPTDGETPVKLKHTLHKE